MRKSGISIATFGPFRLFLDTRRLYRDGELVVIGGRAIELLVTLVEQPGHLIGKQELLERAWPGLFVDEANLRVQMAALRRILGNGPDGHSYITSVVRRGYSFVGDVAFEEASEEAATSEVNLPPVRHNLPNKLLSVVGREDVVASVRKKLAFRRLVTIVGPGGVGKTTTALEVARASLSTFDSVVLVDMAQVADGGDVDAEVTSTTSVVLASGPLTLADPLPIGSALVILDDCEHLVTSVAQVVERIMRAWPSATVLATSREPLHAAGEVVVRLENLEFPESVDDRGTVAMAYPAVRLFVERAAAVLGDHEPQLHDIRAIAEICRRLDGIPLAIELAAGRVDAFGVRGLASRLDDVSHLVVSGRRTVSPRHQTLRAMLHWSYVHLTPSEQRTLCRLAVFAGHFALEAAAEVASIEEPSWETIENLTSLVSKSLVSADFSQTVPRYRLLETTRAYALDRLDEAGETKIMRRRHACHVQQSVAKAEREWGDAPTTLGWRPKPARSAKCARP